MFHRIWHPKEDDLTKFKILFMVSIPICMILPVIFHIMIQSNAWYLISFLWLIIVTAIRIISAIRFQAKAVAGIERKTNKLFGKLSEEDRKQFLKSAFIRIPIAFAIGITGSLFMINIIIPMDSFFMAIVILFFIAIYLYSIWNIYNKLAQGKDLI